MATARVSDSKTGTGQTSGAGTLDLVTMTVPTNTAMHVEGWAAGKNSSTDDGVAARLSGLVKRVAGSAGIVGAIANLLGIQADVALVGAAVNIVVSGNDVILRVTGVVGQTIDWYGKLLADQN